MRRLALAMSAFTLLAAGSAALEPGAYRDDPPELVRLGQLLFYDPILSGNREVSCATCHHPRFATGDGLALGLGDGGKGLGPDRKADPDNLPEQRIPRNAPPLFNLGHEDITVLFADGRIEADDSRPSGFRTPLETDMVAGFDGILSAQTMFPVLSPDEMAGHYQENDVAKAVRRGQLTGLGGAWDIIAERVEGIAAYRTQFHEAIPETATRGVTFADISNAIAAFMAFEWRADQSPYDQLLKTGAPLPSDAEAGRALFFGAAGCSACHSGALLSDQKFHAMGAPQIGPGKAERFESHQRDIGRARVTGRDADLYAFRTPMLRNVTRTGPWGHAGAHADLRAFLKDHADPAAGLARFEASVALPDLSDTKPDFLLLDDATERQAIIDAITISPVDLGDEDLDALLAFLEALTDETSLKGRLGIPQTVPSGLPIDR